MINPYLQQVFMNLNYLYNSGVELEEIEKDVEEELKKLKKGHSTKAERRFSELLKELHIPFRNNKM